MVETHDHFVKRLGSLGRKHAQMTNGYTTKVGRDGLIVVRPKRRARNASGIKFVLLALALFFALKIVLLVSTGSISYEARLLPLQEGTMFEKAGAFVMGIDPITQAGADFAGPILRDILQ
jgi:hypothetical protein